LAFLESAHLAHDALPVHPSRNLPGQREADAQTHPRSHRNLLLLKRLLGYRLSWHTDLAEDLLSMSLGVGCPVLLTVLLLSKWGPSRRLEL